MGGRVSAELQNLLKPLLRAGDLAQCERILNDRLAELPESPFHIALNLSITTNPQGLASVFDDFFRKEASRFPIAAAYTELDVSRIDLWCCSIFAYKAYGGHSDYSWLSDWQSEPSNLILIQGLEPLQKLYSDALQHDACNASDIVDLLVVVKFQDLIRRSAPFMNELRFPLLSTVHDCDLICEIRPKPTVV